MDHNQVRDAAAAEVGKHRRLLRSGRDGRALSVLMLALLRWSPPTGFGVLTTTGRKTGKPRSKCVRVIRRRDQAYLVALRPPHMAVTRPNAVHAWVQSIRANPTVRLKIQELHRYWFDTGIPVVIDLKEIPA